MIIMIMPTKILSIGMLLRPHSGVPQPQTHMFTPYDPNNRPLTKK